MGPKGTDVAEDHTSHITHTVKVTMAMVEVVVAAVVMVAAVGASINTSTANPMPRVPSTQLQGDPLLRQRHPTPTLDRFCSCTCSTYTSSSKVSIALMCCSQYGNSNFSGLAHGGRRIIVRFIAREWPGATGMAYTVVMPKGLRRLGEGLNEGSRYNLQVQVAMRRLTLCNSTKTIVGIWWLMLYTIGPLTSKTRPAVWATNGAHWRQSRQI